MKISDQSVAFSELKPGEVFTHCAPDDPPHCFWCKTGLEPGTFGETVLLNPEKDGRARTSPGSRCYPVTL